MENSPALPSNLIRPIYIRTPRTGERCPYSGLTRSTLISLTLPHHQNGFRPPVASIAPAKTIDAKRRIRLIVWASLEAHIRSQSASHAKSELRHAAAG